MSELIFDLSTYGSFSSQYKVSPEAVLPFANYIGKLSQTILANNRSYIVNSIIFRAKKNGTFANGELIYFRLRTVDSEGKPYGDVLEEVTYDPASLTTSMSDVTINFSGATLFSKNYEYGIEVEYNDALATSDAIWVGGMAGTGLYTYYVGLSPNDEDTWSYPFAGNMNIKIYGTIQSFTLDADATSGIVTKSPTQEYYEIDDNVIIYAGPNENYIFEEWYGDETGTENPKTITMDSNKIIRARISEKKFLQSNLVYYNSTSVVNSRLTVTSTSDISNFNLYLSNNNGVSWENVSNGVLYEFIDNSGEKVKYKIYGNSGKNISNILVEINV
jgi:uncharacterized repeat protein (TIGR02543 family)